MTLHLSTGKQFPDIQAIAKDWAALRPYMGARIIVADPNWKLRDWSEAGDKTKTPDHHYQCRSLEWIQALPVASLAAQNCLLFLWATNPMLPQALQAVDAWGFEFKTSGTWVKRTKHGKLGYGTGRRLRSSNEPFIIAVRGKPAVASAVRSALLTYSDGEAAGICEEDPLSSLGLTIEAKTRQHSRKPEETFDMVRQMVHEGPAIELFSRQKRKGWITWGDQSDKFDEVAA